MVPYLRAASTASITASEVLGASAAKMPPVWNQRTPSSPNSFSQFTSPGLICEAALWPRSEQPSAARMAKPFSVKLRPTRVLRPRPSKSRQMICDVSTPPWQMKSSTSQPRSFLGRAVTTLARLPQHLRMARATLYSPPPSHTWNWRAVRTRPKPGSKRSMISPKELLSPDALDEGDGLGPLLLDAGIILGRQQLLGDEVRADAAGDNAGAEPLLERLFRDIDAAGGHDAGPGHRTQHVLDEFGPADAGARKHLDDLAAQLLGGRDFRGRAAAGA